MALKLKSLALKLKSLAWVLALNSKSLALALKPKSLLTSLVVEPTSQNPEGPGSILLLGNHRYSLISIEHAELYLVLCRVVHESDGPAGPVRSHFCRIMAGRVSTSDFLNFLQIIPWFLNQYKSSNTAFKLIVLSCSPRNYATIVYCSLLAI